MSVNPQPPPISATQVRVRAQRRQLGSASEIYTPDLVDIIHASTGPSDAYKIIMVDATGKIDPSFLPTITTVLLETDNTPNTLQTVLNLKSGTNITLVPDAFGGVEISASGTVGTSFANISSGVNTTAVMTLGAGSSLEGLVDCGTFP